MLDVLVLVLQVLDVLQLQQLEQLQLLLLAAMRQDMTPPVFGMSMPTSTMSSISNVSVSSL